MENKVNFFSWFSAAFKEFFVEAVSKSNYEVVDIYECKKTGFVKAIIKLSARHTIEKSISDIVIDNTLIEGLDKKTIRTLTYMATVEKMKPDFSVVVQKLSEEVDEYILEIKSRNNKISILKSPCDLSKDKMMLAKFSPIDASRIGYLAGIKEAVKEFKMRSKIK